MITTHLRNLLTAVICIFAGATAQAQFTGGVEQYPTTDYSTKAVNFKLSELATALDTDAATLAGALDSWTADGSEDPNMFFLKQADGPSDNYTQGGKGGFWVNVDGTPQAWSDDNSALRWYNEIGWSAEDDVFSIAFGQFPNQCAAGDVFNPVFVLKYGEKTVELNVTFKIVAKPEIPAPTTLVEKDLHIVGEKSITIEQYQRNGYDADAVVLEVADMVEKLGFENDELLADVFGDVLYCTQYNTGDIEEGGGMKMDELTHDFSATAPGFWLRAVQDENGEETGEVSRAPWGEGLKFYAEAFAYDAEAKTVKCNVGQYPGILKGGEEWFVNIYVLRADKAYRLH